MEIKETLLENIGFAIIGGPVLAMLAYAVGTALWGQTAGIALAVVIYVIAFLLVARRDDSGGGGSSDGLDTKKKAEAAPAVVGDG
jgi:hypothetical protein